MKSLEANWNWISHFPNGNGGGRGFFLGNHRLGFLGNGRVNFPGTGSSLAAGNLLPGRQMAASMLELGNCNYKRVDRGGAMNQNWKLSEIGVSWPPPPPPPPPPPTPPGPPVNLHETIGDIYSADDL